MLQNLKSKSLQELLAAGTHALASKKITSPALDAALLLAEVSGISRDKIFTHCDLVLDEAQCSRYYRFLERRLEGECLAYILERKEFWGLEFKVTPAVLVPRPDTETLVEAALQILRKGDIAVPPLPAPHFLLPIPCSPISILDLCTGSGNVAIALKHECPLLEVWAADISRAALDCAKTNAKTLGVTVNFLLSNLFDAVKNRRFTLITVNAPYIPSAQIANLAAEVQREPRLALDGGPDGLDLIKRIIMEAPAFLDSRGYLLLEADPSQMKTISLLMNNNGFAKPELHKDISGKDRVISSYKK